MYQDLMSDNIFADFLVSCKVTSVSPEDVLSDIAEIREETPESALVSNIGGYHSPDFLNASSQFDNMNKLSETCHKFVYNELGSRQWTHKKFNATWWCMINGIGSYNCVHHHGRADIVGVYYAKVPENCGDLVVMRNDGATYSEMYCENGLTDIRITPEAGRFYMMPGHLWHYVDPNQNEETRVAVAFNFHAAH